MNLIVEHKSEFPTKLRPAITTAAAKCKPGIFVSEVYIAATYFFFGQFRPGNEVVDGVTRNEDSARTDGWWGLDHEIDTQDQAELVIRLFPWILQEELMGIPSSKGQIPIFFLALNEKAVSFVPLFAKLGAELGVFGGKKDSAGLTWRGEKSGSALEQLFVNTISTENTNKFDEKSLNILIQLRQMGFLSENNEQQLVLWLFIAAKYREIALIEARLRLVVDWNPTILMNIFEHKNMLGSFLDRFQECNGDESYNLRLFEVIVELGMLHYPLELGFAFHKTDRASKFPETDGNSASNFGLACQIFGTKTSIRILNKAILKAIDENIPDKPSIKNLQMLLFAATTNQNISIEGVYALVRRDPMAIVLPV